MQFKYLLMGVLFVCLFIPTTLAEQITIYDYQDARVVYTGIKEATDHLPIFTNQGLGYWQLSDIMFNISSLSGYTITNATLILYECTYSSGSPYNNMAGTDLYNVTDHSWIPTTAPNTGNSIISTNTTTETTVSFDVTEQLQREIDAEYSNITFLAKQNSTTSGRRLCDSLGSPSPVIPRIIINAIAPPTPTTLQQFPILGVIPVVIACAMLLAIVGSVLLSPKLDLKVIITAGVMLLISIIMLGVIYTI